MSLLPWGALLQAATRIGIAPEAFWRMSLKEWRMLTAGGAAVLGHTELGALAAQYPDAGGRDERSK